MDLSSFTRTNLRNLLQISVDGSDFTSVGLEHLVDKAGTNQLSGQEIAAELTKVIQERFGDGKKFDVSGYLTAATGGGTSDAQLYGAAKSPAVTLDITRDLWRSEPE